MIQNLVRFTIVLVVVTVGLFATLAAVGALSAEQLWDNVSVVLQVVGIVFVTSLAILLVVKK